MPIPSKSVRYFAVALLCVTVLAGTAAGQALRGSCGPATVQFAAGDRPLLEYRYAEVPFKPYVAQMYTPAGVPVLRDSPADHKHHHALMFAVAADGVDFWSEKETCGRQVHRELDGPRVSTTNGETVATLTEQLDWTAPDGRLILNEDRTLTLHRQPGLSATLLTWQSRLRPPPGKQTVALTGSHYFGLGMRFVASMDTVGTFINPSGEVGELVRGDERLVPARWCAYQAPVGNKPVTAAIFDHPHNRRHPARMFTMKQHFAYLAATLNLWKEPLSLEAGDPLTLTYGVALWDGRVEEAEIEATYQRWARQ